MHQIIQLNGAFVKTITLFFQDIFLTLQDTAAVTVVGVGFLLHLLLFLFPALALLGKTILDL